MTTIVSPPLKLVYYPHPALRHPAKAITSLDARVVRIAENMIELMREHKGLGLAAPQVGLPFRLFVAQIPLDPSRPDEVGVFINPVIHDRQGTVEAEEGCLSFPGLYKKVRRARGVTVQAYDIQGRLIEAKLSDMPARIFQHEGDHLDGVLFIDKLNLLGKMTVRSWLSDFERDYKKSQTKGEVPPDADIEKYLAELEANGPPEVPPHTPQAQAL